MFTRRTLASVSLAAMLVFAACGQSAPAASEAPPAALGEMAVGAQDAPVTLVEYASLTCPACKMAHEQILPAIKAKYVASGQVRYIFREFPTPPVPLAVAAAAVSRCAGADKYFEALDLFFAEQNAMIDAARAGSADAKLREVGAKLGLSAAQVDACTASEEIIGAIGRIVEGGEALGVASTPTFFVNGVMVADRSQNGLSAAIDAALAE